MAVALGIAIVLRALALVLHAELMDLAADGVATDAQQLCGLDATPAGGGQGALDLGAFEGARELLEHTPRRHGKQAIRFHPQSVDPARRQRARRLFAHLRR